VAPDLNGETMAKALLGQYVRYDDWLVLEASRLLQCVLVM